QSDHFKNLFAAAKRWGFTVELEHVKFGTVLGRDRKPFRTRDGGVPALNELLDEAVARAQTVVDENSPELPPDARKQVAEIVGIGAVKYADLSQNRTSDYVFDWDKMMAMEGNTATYMQYAFARNRSIFRRGQVDAAPFRTTPPPASLVQPEERALAMQLLRLEEALAATSTDYRPHLITSYLWDLAKTYSGFFQNCP